MAVTFLKSLVQESLGPKKSIIEVLRKNMGGYQPARSHETIHASDITKDDFCPRQTALLTLLNEKKKDEYLSTALRATFDNGNALGQLFCEQWAGQSIVGTWKCRRCGATSTFTKKPVEHLCDANTNTECDWMYEEVRFKDTKYHISGSLDAIMDLGAPKLFVTELKTIAADAFEKLAAPLAEHRIRTSLYLHLVENSDSAFSGQINHYEARILYICRGYGKKHPEYGEILPFKEFKIERNDSTLTPYLQKAAQIRIYKETGKLPHGICSTSMDAPAKKCSVCKACFSGKYPATQSEPSPVTIHKPATAM